MRCDPKKCREEAQRCFNLAEEAPDDALQCKLNELGRDWNRVANDLEAARRLLDDRSVRRVLNFPTPTD